ncbi:MAG TPA: hypothetical protein VGE23_02350 [Candidatus Paceibacterota bacterium]
MTSTRLFAVILLGALALPLSVSAATYTQARTLVLSEPPEGNAYLAGTDVTVVTPLPADVLGAGGTLRIAAPVAGDVVLAGATVSVEQAVQGDVRVAGGQVSVTGAVAGDLALAGGTIVASTTASDIRAIGGTVSITGSSGRTVVYGSDVRLAGTFASDVEIVATDRLTLAEGTVILGNLRYDAPQQAGIPASAQIEGEVTYTGASSYLPTAEEAQTFAIAGAGVFLIVRMLAVLIGAALLAGLFPVFSQKVADRVLAHSPGRFALLALLGFAIVFATPMLILLLLVSFVGTAVAIVLLLGYLLLLMLGYLYAGVIAGAALGRGLLKRPQVSWRIALLGMLALYLVGLVPVLGDLITFVLFLAATGALTAIAYRFSFKNLAEENPELS